MQRRTTLAAQVTSLRAMLLMAYLPVIAVLLLIGLQDALPVKTLTRDPNQFPGLSVFTGVLSNLGILLWCATASICLFTALSIRRRRRADDVPAFLLAGGALTLLLLIDDLFLLHEQIFPLYLKVSEIQTTAAYALAAVVIAARYRKTLLSTELLPLLLALLFFGASIFFDFGETTLGIFQDGQDNLGFLIEDGGKILGIASWFTYFARVCFVELRGGSFDSQH